MSIFNLTDEKMKETSSTFTAHEIYQQPATWRKTCAQLAACKDELQAFIDQVVKQDDFDIVLRSSPTLLPTSCLPPRTSSPAPSPPCW